MWREAHALNEYLGILGRTLDVSLIHPGTRRNALPVDLPTLHGEPSRTPTNEDADKVREVLRGLRQVRRLLDIRDDPEVETEVEEAEPLPAA